MENIKMLVQLSLAGNEGAQWALFSATANRVYYTSEVITAEPVLAVHAAAESYRLGFQNLSCLDYPQEFPLWIERIAVYLAFHSAREKTARLGMIGAFLREFCKMSETELSQLFQQEPLPPTDNGGRQWKSDSEILIAPAVLNRIWEEMHRCAPACVPGVSPGQEPASVQEDVPSRASRSLARRRKTAKRRAALLAAAALCAGAFAGYGLLRGPDENAVRPTEQSTERSGREEQVQQLASRFAAQLSGQLGGVYPLSEDSYLVVVDLIPQRAAPSERNGGRQEHYTIYGHFGGAHSSTGEAAYSEDPYLSISFQAIEKENKTASEVKTNSALPAVPSVNRLQIDGELIQALLDVFQPSGADADETAQTEELAEDLSIMLRVNCREVDISQPMALTLDASIAKALGRSGGLQFRINDDQHQLALSRGQLLTLLENYGTVLLYFYASGPQLYDISFFDSEGTPISELFGDISFTLPAGNALSYVFATYPNGSESRGGVYNSTTGTISFPVSHSGLYRIIGSEIEIQNLSTLGQEEAKAAEFMVALQFMSLDEAGNFRADAEMTRGEFVQILGKMFLATEKGLTTGFSDVDTDDPEYDIVSYGSINRIFKGFGDGTFRGDSAITRAEMLSLCGRTLAYRMGSELTEQTENQAIPEGTTVPDYARPAIEILLQEGLLAPEDTAGLQAKTRQMEAALVLYRMYSRLYGS